MKRFFRGLVSLALLSVAAGVTSADTMDDVTLESPTFGTMDLQTGAFTAIGSGISGIEDLTRLPGGPLYGVNSYHQLLDINPSTGVASLIGLMGNDIYGAKLDANGTLFGYNRTDLYTVNTSNGNVALVGAFGIPTGGYYDAAFNGNNMYFQETNGAASTSNLYTVNTSTGQASLVGNVGFSVGAMDFEKGTLYGFTLSGQIITINTATGSGTFLVNQQTSSAVFAAATAASAVPEPGSLCLLSLGLAAVATFRLRVRKSTRS
jgi:PEP-CTERM motif